MFSCRNTCSMSNPTTDTVRFDPKAFEESKVVERWEASEGRGWVELHEGDRLVVGGASNKEQADSLVQEWQEEKQRREQEAAAKAEKKAEEARCKEQAEVAARVEQARLAREKEEREARERHERAAEAQRQQELRRQELERKEREEQEQRHREAELAAEKHRRELVAAFLKRHGFGIDVCGPKRAQDACGLPFMSKTVYPIHTAAELGDAAMVEMLLKEGASASQKTSGGKTAADLAQKRDKAGSHTAVLQALGAQARTCKAGGA
eukprot:gb/GFBE01072728.1/.p1 GENE.gb/GFBE01072728.1/~~gb/GFBE01072728.1/.p1  ORF type:complete len:265 (+),score=79.91 gb/GFBE01072728.1/:1-795(+)